MSPEFSWRGAFTSTSSTVQTQLCCVEVGLDFFCAGLVKKDAILLWTRFILPSFNSIHLAMLISVYVILLCIQCIDVHGDVRKFRDCRQFGSGER